MLETTCPQCGKRIRFGREGAGRKVRCPNAECRNPLILPGKEEPAERRCPACDQRLLPRETSCPECGTRPHRLAEKRCPACDRRLLPRETSCPKCGVRPDRFVARRDRKQRAIRAGAMKQAAFSESLEAPETIDLFAVSPDGARVVGCGEGWIGAWDLSSGRLTAQWEVEGACPTALAVSPDGRSVLIGIREKRGLFGWKREHSLFLWRPGTGQAPCKRYETKRAVIAVAFASEGRCGCSLDARGDVRVWELESGKPVREFQTRRRSMTLTAARFSHDGMLLATGTSTGHLQVWNIADGKPREMSVERLLGWRSRAGLANNLDWSRDGTRIVSCSGPKVENLYSDYPWYGAVLYGPLGWVWGKTISGIEHSRIQTAHRRRTRLRCWMTETGQEAIEVKNVLDYHERGIFAVAVSPAGTRAVTGSFDGTIRYWNLQTGTHICEVTPVGEVPFSFPAGSGFWRASKPIAFSADGKQVLFAVGDRRIIEVWGLPDQ